MREISLDSGVRGCAPSRRESHDITQDIGTNAFGLSTQLRTFRERCGRTLRSLDAQHVAIERSEACRACSTRTTRACVCASSVRAEVSTHDPRQGAQQTHGRARKSFFFCHLDRVRCDACIADGACAP
jgi:hypothetical protein